MAAAVETMQQDRRRDRRRVLMNAMLLTREGVTNVRIRDISATGAQVVGVRGISSNCEAVFKRHSLFAVARIIWVDGDEGGLAFYRALKADELDPKLRQAIAASVKNDQDGRAFAQG